MPQTATVPEYRQHDQERCDLIAVPDPSEKRKQRVEQHQSENKEYDEKCSLEIRFAQIISAGHAERKHNIPEEIADLEKIRNPVARNPQWTGREQKMGGTQWYGNWVLGIKSAH
jgi:hypothetical protein